MSTDLFSFLVGLFQVGLGRVKNGKDVWLGSKTGKRFGSGRKQERGLGRVENRKDVWLGSKTGKRFGSGRKREGRLTWVENRKKVWVGSKTGRRFEARRSLGRVENMREVWVGLKTGGRLYRCTYAPLIVDMSSDVMWYSGLSFLVIYRATRGLGLVKRLRYSSFFKQKYSFKGVGIIGKFDQYFPLTTDEQPPADFRKTCYLHGHC